MYCNLTGLDRIKLKFVPLFLKKQISLVSFSQLNCDNDNSIVHIFSTRILNKMFNEMNGKATIKITDDNTDDVIIKKITKLNRYANHGVNVESCGNRFQLTTEILNTLLKIIVCADFAAYEYFEFMNSKRQKKVNSNQFLFSIITKNPSYEINKKVYENYNNKLMDIHLKKSQKKVLNHNDGDCSGDADDSDADDDDDADEEKNTDDYHNSNNTLDR